jgi:hypothetical protein
MDEPSFRLEFADFSMMRSRNVNRTTSVVQELPPLGAKTIQPEKYPADRTRVIIGSQKSND